MKRHLALSVVGALAVAVTAAPAVAKPAAPCATFTDPKGDSGPPADAALDITSVTYKTVGKELVGTITADQVSSHPTFAPGNRFQLDFQLAGHAVTLYYKFSPTRDQEANAFYQQGLRVDGTFVTDTVTGTVKGNTVAIAIPYAELKGALGKVMGKPLTGLTAQALASYVATNQSWDTATAPSGMTYVAGSACA